MKSQQIPTHNWFGHQNRLNQQDPGIWQFLQKQLLAEKKWKYYLFSSSQLFDSFRHWLFSIVFGILRKLSKTVENYQKLLKSVLATAFDSFGQFSIVFEIRRKLTKTIEKCRKLSSTCWNCPVAVEKLRANFTIIFQNCFRALYLVKFVQLGTCVHTNTRTWYLARSHIPLFHNRETKCHAYLDTYSCARARKYLMVRK